MNLFIELMKNSKQCMKLNNVSVHWPDLTFPPINLLSIGYYMMNNTVESYYDNDEFKHYIYKVQFADATAELHVNLLLDNYDEDVVFPEQFWINSGNITRRQFVLALRQLATLIEKG